MTQENHDINQQLLDHLESGTWDPYHQQHTSASDKARLVFDIQQRVRRTNMQRLSSRPFRAMVWVLVLFMVAAGAWAFMSQNRPAVVDNLVNPNLAQPGQAGEESTLAPYDEAEQIAAADGVLRFGDNIYLSDYVITINKLNDQTHFGFSLHWDSARDVTGQINLFAHLLRQDGSVIAIHEVPIFVSDSSSPQDTWTGVRPVEQFFHFAVGDEAAAAEPYQLYFGLYDVSSGERLPITFFEVPQADNQLRLTEVKIDDDQELIIAPNSDGVMVADLYTPDRPESSMINVAETQFLLLVNDNGAAIVAFEFAGRDDIVTYRWRYRPAVGGLESVGNGILQEVYAQTPTADGFHLVDMGSELFINIADMSVEWSYNTEETGWVYYDPNLIDAQVIDDDFDTFDLSTVMP